MLAKPNAGFVQRKMYSAHRGSCLRPMHGAYCPAEEHRHPQFDVQRCCHKIQIKCPWHSVKYEGVCIHEQLTVPEDRKRLDAYFACRNHLRPRKKLRNRSPAADCYELEGDSPTKTQSSLQSMAYRGWHAPPQPITLTGFYLK